jgi:hypothetical protein
MYNVCLAFSDIGYKVFNSIKKAADGEPGSFFGGILASHTIDTLHENNRIGSYS